MHLTRLLCETVKIRLADDVYSVVSHDPYMKPIRHVMAQMDDNQLGECALDQDRTLAERALALWLLIGTHRYRSDHLPMRSGMVEAAAHVMRVMHAPEDLTENCITALKKSAYPLALWTPLLWTEIKKQPRAMLTWTDTICPTRFYKDIPLVALDGFTRIGRASFAALKRAAPALSGFTIAQIALAVFYIEGGCIDKRITSPVLEQYRQTGEACDIGSTGLRPERYAELRHILIHHAETLETIRIRQLKAYLHGSREQSGLKSSHV